MVLERLQVHIPEEVQESAVRPAADPSRAQGGLPRLSLQWYERAVNKREKAISPDVKAAALRVE